MNIWVPRLKIIEPRSPLPAVTQLAGFFKFTAIRPDGRRRPLTDWFPNLILDQGLNFIGTTATWLGACRVGSGNTAPANSQTNLVSHVAGSTNQVNTNESNSGSPPYYGYKQITWRFDQGAAAGNLAEVGVGTGATNASNLFSRALILDSEGAPTTITVLSDEFLDVSYELRCYVPTDDVLSTISVTGVGDIDVVARASRASNVLWNPSPSSSSGFQGGGSNVTVYNGAIGSITDSPAGASSNGSVSNEAYSDASYHRNFIGTWSLTQGNVAGGISAVRATMNCGEMQYGLDPVIPKDGTQVLTLNFDHVWARKTL
jgi:hypothetical protein